MTDERFVFQQDIKERGRIKTGAIHRKNGSKSRKCTLPSDHLTASQKRKLNGECESINLNQPIDSLKDLRKYSESLQTEYLQNCISKYGARKKDILDMLHTTNANFRRYIEGHNINLIFPKAIKGRGSKMDDKWLDFITKPEDKIVKKTDEQIIEEQFGVKLSNPEEQMVGDQHDLVKRPDPPIAKISRYNAVLKMSLDLRGSKSEIMQMMDAILGQECNYIVNLNIVNADKEENG